MVHGEKDKNGLVVPSVRHNTIPTFGLILHPITMSGTISAGSNRDV